MADFIAILVVRTHDVSDIPGSRLASYCGRPWWVDWLAPRNAVSGWGHPTFRTGRQPGGANDKTTDPVFSGGKNFAPKAVGLSNSLGAGDQGLTSGLFGLARTVRGESCAAPETGKKFISNKNSR